MNICNKPAQGYSCDEQGNAMKQLVVKQDGQQLLHQLRYMEVGKESVIPSIRFASSEQLRSCFCMWLEENITEAIRETSKYCQQYWKNSGNKHWPVPLKQL